MRYVIAGLLRRLHNIRRRRKERALWSDWSAAIESIDAASILPKAAVIRLDDIGDYILWQQFLPSYGQYCKAQGLQPILIGNEVWKPLHAALYPKIDAIWINKGRYFSDEGYRLQLWQQLASEGFQLCIAPARTRRLLLDDAIALATKAPQQVAGQESETIGASTKPYTALYAAAGGHEWVYNRNLCVAITGYDIAAAELKMPLPKVKCMGNTILFIGASAGSKRWPAAHWARLSQYLAMEGHNIVLAGGHSDQKLACEILALQPQLNSKVAKLGLLESIKLLAAAKLIVSGDTMAAHAAVASQVPLVLIANGTNASRFTDYQLARVRTLYPIRYVQQRDDRHYEATTADLATLTPDDVMEAIESLAL